MIMWLKQLARAKVSVFALIEMNLSRQLYKTVLSALRLFMLKVINLSICMIQRR